MDTENRERRNIKVKLKTYRKLQQAGVYGETMDDIINRLLFQEKTRSKAQKSKVEDKV